MCNYLSPVDVAKEVRESFGIFDSRVELSVGLESVNNHIKDLQQSFKKKHLLKIHFIQFICFDLNCVKIRHIKNSIYFNPIKKQKIFI